MVGRQQGIDAQAAQRRAFPRWREVRRRRRQVQHRAPQEPAGIEPQRRTSAGEQRGRAGPLHRAPQPGRTLLATARRAGRPRGHDGLAQGRAGAGRAVCHQAGVFGAVPLCRTRAPGPHGVRALPRVLEQGCDPLRQGGLHAHYRLHREAGQPEVRPARFRRTCRRVRHGGDPQGQEAQERQHHRDRLPGHHDQRGKKRAGAEEPAGQGRARARSLRALARPRRPGPGGDGQ